MDTPIDGELARHSICLNKSDNGGEQVWVTTSFIGNGKPVTDTLGVFTNQEILSLIHI